MAKFNKRLTGADLDTNNRWQVAGTDLGIPYVLENSSIGYLFGDTFNTARPEESNNDWRSPVLLRSNVHPASPGGIVFDSAAKVAGNGRAPEILDFNAHGDPKGEHWPDHEITCIPNDGISFPETQRQVISFQSINRWREPWRSRYASLAYSDNGNDFIRVPNLAWWNTESNTDPFQMWTMQRDGEWVYVFSVRSGRQPGPMMLQRVHWQQMFDKSRYQGWGWNGTNWGWGRPCTPIIEGTFGEPSVRKLADGAWGMCYLNGATGNIVSRTASGPNRIWSREKIQVTARPEPNMSGGLYGGFIHPWSRRGAKNLHIMVSKWTRDQHGTTAAYHVSQYVGTL